MHGILNKCHASKKLAIKPNIPLNLNPSIGLPLIYLFLWLFAGFQNCGFTLLFHINLYQWKSRVSIKALQMAAKIKKNKLATKPNTILYFLIFNTIAIVT